MDKVKRFFSVLVLLTLGFGALSAQTDFHKAASKLKPAKYYKNIHVKKLFSDAKASGFVIWIKEKVPLHKHARHSETVYILRGKGDMRLGERLLKVKKGDIIFIPEGSPHSVRVTRGVLKVISIQAPEFKGKDRIML